MSDPAQIQAGVDSWVVASRWNTMISATVHFTDVADALHMIVTRSRKFFWCPEFSESQREYDTRDDATDKYRH